MLQISIGQCQLTLLREVLRVVVRIDAIPEVGIGRRKSGASGRRSGLCRRIGGRADYGRRRSRYSFCGRNSRGRCYTRCCRRRRRCPASEASAPRIGDRLSACEVGHADWRQPRHGAACVDLPKLQHERQRVFGNLRLLQLLPGIGLRAAAKALQDGRAEIAGRRGSHGPDAGQEGDQPVLVLVEPAAGAREGRAKAALIGRRRGTGREASARRKRVRGRARIGGVGKLSRLACRFDVPRLVLATWAFTQHREFQAIGAGVRMRPIARLVVSIEVQITS